MSQLSATAKLFGTTTLNARQAALARQTYAYLSFGILSAVVGGYLGAGSMEAVRFFARPLGWILALVVINIVPRLALWASEKNQLVALLMLGLDGFISGLVLAPLLYLVTLLMANGAPNLLAAAGGVTLAMFLGVTGYMLVSRRRFSAPVGLITGMFVTVMAAVTLNLFLHVGALGFFVSLVAGAMGVLMLVYATSDVLNNPDYDNPIQGALMLFAALFNIFVSLLNLMLRLFSSGRD